jgi:hypothetical protein
MPHYRVRLRIGPDHAWTTRVPVNPWQQLTDGQIEQEALKQAIAFFGDQARSWTLLDHERRSR